jgi:segregation and condensation protein B
VGKPILYKTTREFMIQFGLNDLSELPTLKEFEELSKLALSDSEPDGSADAEPPIIESEVAETPTEAPVSEEG